MKKDHRLPLKVLSNNQRRLQSRNFCFNLNRYQGIMYWTQ